MNKRALHHKLVVLKKVPYLSFLIAGLVFLSVSVLALRANNQKMIELRAAVFVADEEDGDIEGALKTLREHVYTHMNTDLAAGPNAIRPPIQLKYHYERLVLAEQARLGKSSNRNVYTDAQNYCEEQNPTGFSGRNRLDCVRDYIYDHGVEQKEVNVPEDLYKFDFSSPRWSPDLAGWSLLLAAISFGLFAISFLSELVLRHQLRQHE